MVHFFDKTDGVTPETALTVTSCKLTFVVDDANVPTLVLDTAPTASGGANDMVHIAGDDAGFYDLELAAENVNYLGRAMLAITDAATHCPIFHEFMIIPAMIYDSIILGTDRFDTNVTHIGDTSQTARDIGASVLLSSGTGTGQVKLSSGYMAPNWGDVGNPTTTVGLTGTTIATTQAVNVGSLNGSSAAAARLALSAGVIIPGTVDSTAFTPTTTEFESDDITEATAQHYNGRVVVFTSGALVGQATSISNYSLQSGRGHFTVVALTEALGNNDTFIIV